MRKSQKFFLYFVLIYASQHLVRDILSDILGIHNWFTQIGHRESSNALWCGALCKWTTFPIEIFYIVSSFYQIKQNKFGTLGWIMIFLLIPILLQYSDIIIK